MPRSQATARRVESQEKLVSTIKVPAQYRLKSTALDGAARLCFER